MSNQSPIATTIFCEIRETIINLLTVSLMAILWQRFGLQVTLPIFIVTLLFVAPLIGASRLPLVAITFLTIGIDMAKEKKISEAGIFFIVVVISILIDELIRGLNKGFPKLQLKSLKPSLERNMLFAFSSSAFFFAYLIYEHYSMSNPFFAKLGDALINSFPNISRGGGNTGFTVFIIMVVGTFPGATISSIMSSESDVFKPFVATVGSFVSAIFVGPLIALFLVIILLPIDYGLKQWLGGNIANSILQPFYWLLIYFCVVLTASTGAGCE